MQNAQLLGDIIAEQIGPGGNNLSNLDKGGAERPKRVSQSGPWFISAPFIIEFCVRGA